MKIPIRHVCKRYGTHQVLSDFCCSLQRGVVNVLLGPSGSGKTTLLRLIMNLEQPDSGELTAFQDLKISAVFQEDRLCEQLDAYTNVRLVSSSVQGKQKILQAFSEVGLDPYCTKPTRTYSGGMKRRVALVRALFMDYDLLILDEPFKGLDEQTKHKVIEYTKQTTHGKTVLMVTHDQEEVNLMQPAAIIRM